jgi:hypothetical protein
MLVLEGYVSRSGKLISLTMLLVNLKIARQKSIQSETLYRGWRNQCEMGLKVEINKDWSNGYNASVDINDFADHS